MDRRTLLSFTFSQADSLATSKRSTWRRAIIVDGFSDGIGIRHVARGSDMSRAIQGNRRFESYLMDVETCTDRT